MKLWIALCGKIALEGPLDLLLEAPKHLKHTTLFNVMCTLFG